MAKVSLFTFRLRNKLESLDLAGSIDDRSHSSTSLRQFLSLFTFRLMVVLTGLCWGCNPPSDPVLMGDLCTQDQAGCTRSVTLERGVVQGRNVIDYEISNATDQTQQIVLRVGPAAVFEEVFSDDETPGEVTAEEETELEQSEFYLSRELTLAPQSSEFERFTADELGRESRLWFAIGCKTGESCDATLRYILLVDPLECESQESCLSGWECDVERGRCLECIPGENMCSAEQTCELGRCTPPAQSTCQSVPARAGHLPGELLLICLLAGLVVSVRRKQLPVTCTAFLTAASLLVTLCTPRDANAQGTLAELTFGAGMRAWSGEVNEQIQPGVGFEVEQELYLTRSVAEARQGTQNPWTFGAGIKLGVFSFVARPALEGSAREIPFNGDLQSYHVQLGPRVRKVVWRGLFIKAGVDYIRMNTGGSALTPLTGLQRAWHSGGISARVGYELKPLVFELEAVSHIIPGLQGNMWGTMVRIGVISF